MIRYLVGDATVPAVRPAVIAHICNNKGGFGSGFALAVANKWPHVRNEYRRPGKWPLGTTQTVHVGPGLFVVNMIAQDGIMSYANRGRCLVSFSHLEQCLAEVGTAAKMYSASVHMPRIGMKRGGCKDWREIESRIEKRIKDVDVYVYDLPEGERE